jgi:hypothetical protein
MNKKTAHLIIGIFDLAAIAACYYVFYRVGVIHHSINSDVKVIELQRPIGLYLLLLIVPVVHVLGLFRFSQKILKFVNISAIFCFLLLLVAGLYADRVLESQILKAGYQYCPTRSSGGAFSEFRVYLHDGIQCSD